MYTCKEVETPLTLNAVSISTWSTINIFAPNVSLTGATRLTAQRVIIFSCSDISVGSETMISTTGRGYGPRQGPGFVSGSKCAYHASMYGNRSYPTTLGSGGCCGGEVGGGNVQLEAGLGVFSLGVATCGACMDFTTFRTLRKTFQ